MNRPILMSLIFGLLLTSSANAEPVSFRISRSYGEWMRPSEASTSQQGASKYFSIPTVSQDTDVKIIQHFVVALPDAQYKEPMLCYGSPEARSRIYLTVGGEHYDLPLTYVERRPGGARKYIALLEDSDVREGKLTYYRSIEVRMMDYRGSNERQGRDDTRWDVEVYFREEHPQAARRTIRTSQMTLTGNPDHTTTRVVTEDI